MTLPRDALQFPAQLQQNTLQEPVAQQWSEMNGPQEVLSKHLLQMNLQLRLHLQQIAFAWGRKCSTYNKYEGMAVENILQQIDSVLDESTSNI